MSYRQLTFHATLRGVCKNAPYEKPTLRKTHPTKKNPTKKPPYEKKPYKKRTLRKKTLQKTHPTKKSPYEKRTVQKKAPNFFCWLCALREAYFASHTNYVFRVPFMVGCLLFWCLFINGAFLMFLFYWLQL